MSPTTLATIVCALLAVGSTALLATGSGLLVVELPGGLPLGNLTTWIGLIALAAIGFLGARRSGPRWGAALGGVVAAAAWFPIAALLAGDLRLNYEDGRGDVAMRFTVGLVAYALAMIVWRVVESVLRRRAASRDG